MPFACPRTCGRLTTGAIFISFGVVQLTAAVILLKSKYVYLLSAPNIWTAISNIAVGGLLGLSALVWKSTSKHSSTHAVRRNILTALMTSAILLNTTTAVLLIMGEGNTLLSIHLERNGKAASTTLISELLAYAYAASVCSPILCVVVAIIFLAGMCFPTGKKSFNMKSVLESDSGNFNWVYKTERHGLPIPDPEIVRNALSSRSFTDSESSYSSTHNDLPTSRKKIIDRIENQGGNTFPQAIHQRSGFSENYPHTISRSGNRVSFADDPSVYDRTVQNYGRAELEKSSVELHSPPKLQSKKRGDLSAVRYAPTICQNEECRTAECFRTPNPLVNTTVSTFADTSVMSERDDIPPNYSRVFDETRYSSPEAENFVKNLNGFEHEHLRRTSTTANPNYPSGMLENSQRDVCFKSPMEYHNHSMHKNSFGGNSDVRNSNRELYDQRNQMMDSRTENLYGEVVPIRIHSVPRKKLPSKLKPVLTPVVPDMKSKHLLKSKERKLDDAETEDLPTFRVGHQMKNRSKSAGSHSAKHSEYFAVSTPEVSDFEVPIDETTLQLSPAHTSGYISAFEDNMESSSHDHSTASSSAYAGIGSSSSNTARKKFRSAHRKILESGRTPPETDVINDMIQKISENPHLSNKESVTELFLDLLFQTIDYQSTKRTKNDSL